MPTDDIYDEDRPRRPRRPMRDDEDEYDDRPRRRRRNDYEDGDATGGLIPYKNAMALAGYYCGVVGLLPVLGLVLGPLAIVFSILGLRHKSRHPAHGGTAHAVVGIVLGAFSALYNWLGAILILIGGLK